MNNGRSLEILQKLHSNIRVLVHPPTVPVKWAHHQKIVVVDQDVAVIGGLDLCFGRYDTSRHKITDELFLQMTWPGKDYFNECLDTFKEVDKPFVDGVDRTTHPR